MASKRKRPLRLTPSSSRLNFDDDSTLNFAGSRDVIDQKFCSKDVNNESCDCGSNLNVLCSSSDVCNKEQHFQSTYDSRIHHQLPEVVSKSQVLYTRVDELLLHVPRKLMLLFRFCLFLCVRYCAYSTNRQNSTSQLSLWFSSSSRAHKPISRTLFCPKLGNDFPRQGIVLWTALLLILTAASVQCLIPQNAAVNIVPAQHVVVGPSPAYGQLQAPPPVYGTSAPSGYGNTDDPYQVWVAGFDNNFQPWSYTDKSTATSGTLRGFFVDVWFHVCRIARKKCRAVAIDIQDCFNYTTYMAGRGLQMGIVDTCGGVAPFETAEQSADFGIPIAAYPETGIVVPKGNPRRIEPSELSGKRIGVTTDSFYVDLRDCLTRNGVTDFIPVFGNFSYLGSMVLSGGIDGRIGFPAAPLGFTEVVDYAGNITPFQCTEEVATFAWNVRNFKFAKWFVPALDVYLNSKEFELMCFHADQLYGWPVNCLPRYRVQQYSVQQPPPTYYHKHLQNPYEVIDSMYNSLPVSNYPPQPQYQPANVLPASGGYSGGPISQAYQQYPPAPPPGNFYKQRGHALYGRSANPNAQLAFNYLLKRPVLSPKTLDSMASLTPRINFESGKLSALITNSVENGAAASTANGKVQPDMPHAEMRSRSSNGMYNISEIRTSVNNIGVGSKARSKDRSAALTTMPLVLATSGSSSSGETRKLVKDSI